MGPDIEQSMETVHILGTYRQENQEYFFRVLNGLTSRFRPPGLILKFYFSYFGGVFENFKSKFQNSVCRKPETRICDLVSFGTSQYQVKIGL